MRADNWTRNQADEIVACARRWIKRLDERGIRSVPPPPSARNHKKRHSVNRERSREARVAAAKATASIAANTEARQRRKAILRAYFSGEIPDLSSLKD